MKPDSAGPDFVFWLDVEPQACVERITFRGRLNKRQPEFFEQLEVLEKVHNGYEQAWEWYKHTFPGFYRVDGSGSRKKIFEHIVKLLKL